MGCVGVGSHLWSKDKCVKCGLTLPKLEDARNEEEMLTKEDEELLEILERNLDDDKKRMIILEEQTTILKNMRESEVRVTDPKTGGQKGSKLAQLGALCPLALTEVAKVAGFGAMKYARYNFVRGFDWSLSYDALQRHLHAFWSGEDVDQESELFHLAHAGWQCMCLLTFVLRKRGTDDRPHKYLESLKEGEK